MFNGERLKQARQNKGYTQAELARVTGVKQQMISKLEIGKAGATSDIVTLAYALDVEPAWLQGISEESAPYTRRISSRSKFNEKAIEMVFEFLDAEYQKLFERANPHQKSAIFLSCYDVCLSAEYSNISRKDDRKALFSAMHKALKNRVKRS